MIKTILIDDERPALNNLERLLKGYDQIEIIGAYTDVTKVFEKIKKEKVHMFFLDIDMPKMKGIDAAKKILEIDSNVQIVFVTAYNDYAVDAFEVEATDYVMKPIMKRRLDKTIERVIKRYKDIENDHEEENKISCFGNFEIRRGQQEIKWRTSKSEEFIAYLVHNRGEFVHKSKIIEALWPDKDEKQATKLLHTNVYYVRNGLKSINLDQAITYSNKMYKFDMGIMFCDIEEFDKTFSSYEVITSKNVDNLKITLHLYKGEYFEGNDYYWAMNEQARFSKMYMNMLMKISDFYIGEDKYSEAIIYLKLIIDKEPYIEDIHRKLLEVYANMEDYINFEKHYRNMTNDFKQELGIELSDMTKELYRNGIGKIKNKD
ncbi:MAG: response regulator [Vallitalea sp.]|nr:response regulator [Vallitalea sp.]